MKKVIRFSLFLIVLSASACNLLTAQVTFSRFDYNTATFTDASIGPNAIAMDPDVVSDGSAVYIGNNCGGVKGIDMTIPNTGNIFDQPSMGMTFRFRSLETRSDFFVRGGTSFYQTGGFLHVHYRTDDGAGGFIDFGPYNTGYLLEENVFHIYTFLYVASTGIATVTVDGMQVWINDGPDGLGFYWVGAPNPVVGTVMDGNCNGVGILDYAFFFIPDAPLPIEFQSFEAAALGTAIDLDWTVATENATQPYQIERSKNGVDFAVIAQVEPEGGQNSHAYHLQDAAPGSGTVYYRIRQANDVGGFSSTEVRSVRLEGTTELTMQAWPNPLSVSNGGQLSVALTNVKGNANFVVVDAQGRIGMRLGLGTDDIRDLRAQLDLSSLAPGVYILRCDCDGTQLTQKLVIQ